MPLDPYPYAVLTFAGGVAVLVGVGAYFWLRRSRTFEFPTPTLVSKANYWFRLALDILRCICIRAFLVSLATRDLSQISSRCLNSQ